MQFSIHAETDLNMILFRADMNVTGCFANSLGKDGIREANDRCTFGHIQQGADLDIFGGSFCFRHCLFGILHGLHIFQGSADSRQCAVNTADQLIKLLFGANNGFHFGVCKHFD